MRGKKKPMKGIRGMFGAAGGMLTGHADSPDWKKPVGKKKRPSPQKRGGY